MSQQLHNACFLQDGETALHRAVLHDSTAVASVLLDHHANVNAADKVCSERDGKVLLPQSVSIKAPNSQCLMHVPVYVQRFNRISHFKINGPLSSLPE